MGIPLSGGTGWGPGENCCLFTLTTPDRGIIRQVQCQGENIVALTWTDDTRLQFIDRALRDSLPALQSLKIERCLAITAPFPEWMTNWTQIVELRLGYNKLTGIMPPDLRGMQNLKVLDLTGNQLTGPLPLVPPTLDTCLFGNNNVCTYAANQFPSNMAVPCNSNIPICPTRTSGTTATSRSKATTTTTTTTYHPNLPTTSPNQAWRFTGCVPLNTTTYPDPNTVCRNKHDTTYLGQWSVDKTPMGEACSKQNNSGIWCLVDETPVPPVTYTTSFAPLPTDGPWFPPEATPLALPDSALVSLSSSSGSFGPSGLLCSTTSCSMSATSAGQYRVQCPAGESTCGVFLLIDTGNRQDGCLSVLKDWSDPAVIPCQSIRRGVSAAKGTGSGRMVLNVVLEDEQTVHGQPSPMPVEHHRLRQRQFANMTELVYLPYWSFYNISSDKAHTDALVSLNPPTNVTKIMSAHLTSLCLVLPNASETLGSVTVASCNSPGSDEWILGGMPSNSSAARYKVAGVNIGLIVGIAVGATAALLLAVGLGVYFVRSWRRRNQHAKMPPSPDGMEADNDIKAALSGGSKGVTFEAKTGSAVALNAQLNAAESAFSSDAASLDTETSSITSRRTFGSGLSSSFSLTSSVDPSMQSYPYGYSYYNRPPETRITSALLDASKPGREVRPKHMEIMPRIPPPSPSLAPANALVATEATAATKSAPTVAGASPGSGHRTLVPGEATSMNSGKSTPPPTGVKVDSQPGLAALSNISTLKMPPVTPISAVPAAALAAVAESVSSEAIPETPVTPSNPFFHFVNSDLVYRVLKPYTAAEEDELTIRPGQLIRVEAAFRDGWGKCSIFNALTGDEEESGMTPLGFLDPEGCSLQAAVAQATKAAVVASSGSPARTSPGPAR